jgi:NtrC-family two-component system response regulator AlgB
VRRFTPEALAALCRHPWPGNVRELRNAVERGVILTADHEVGLAHLPAQVGQPAPTARIEVGGAVTLEAVEAEHIRRVLNAAPSLEDAAQTLGIDPSTLYRKRKKLGL